MVAPAATARGNPGGTKIQEGYKSTITFEDRATFEVLEIDVQLPEIMGGDRIKTSTQHNDKYHTYAPASLIDLGEITVTCAMTDNTHDPAIYETLLNVNMGISIDIAGVADFNFWGYLRSIGSATLSEGALPTVDLIIAPTNTDDAGAEADPTASAPS